MKNVKDEVFAALLTVSEHVSDAYPKEWAGNEPTIQFTEEDNSVFEGSGSAEGMREDAVVNALESRSQSKDREAEIHIYLEGDADKLFKIVRKKGQQYQKSTGKPVFS